MPEILRTSGTVDEILQAKMAEAGLTREQCPTAVRLAINALNQGIMGAYTGLLEELPADARAFDWMEIVFASFAEYCARTVVVDATAPPTEAS